ALPCPPHGDGAAAPMETGPQPSTSSCAPPAHPPTVEDDLQFVLCERCRQESPNLKLLTCLHTLCLGCLSENKPIGQCPVCQTAIPQASGIPDMDNLLFTNLQARLSIYKKIRDGHGLNCCRCRGAAAAMWCSECEEFLCTKCFEDHQWFFKKKSHEAKRVEDLRAESAHQFLEDSRKSCNLFCSRPGMFPFPSSIYCNKCEKALCCSCALLDSQHAPFCDIHSETQRRQEELVTMSQELKQKRSSFEATFEVLQAEASRLEQAQREMRELIRQHVEQLVRLIRREEEELLGLVEARWYRVHGMKQHWRGCPHLGVHPRAAKGWVVNGPGRSCKTQEIRSVLAWENQYDPKSVLNLPHPPVPSAEDNSIIISSSEDSLEDTAVSTGGWGPEKGTPKYLLQPHPFPSTAQRITEMAAANGEHTFKTLIQTPESVLALLSQGVSMEVGMQHLLWYLSPLPRPTLIVYNFWALELPTLFKALDAMGRKVDFCHIVGGYVDMLSLIKEKLPKAPSYKLKNLLRSHLQQQLNEGSALATAKALQELWGALGLPACADARMMLTHCNLQSYTILRPLVQEKLLSKRAGCGDALQDAGHGFRDALQGCRDARRGVKQDSQILSAPSTGLKMSTTQSN
uniref:Protein PML n=1 Tax=Bubo bubo TaxID=30461 RepID=A0A8C0EUS6_BUBBB